MGSIDLSLRNADGGAVLRLLDCIVQTQPRLPLCSHSGNRIKDKGNSEHETKEWKSLCIPKGPWRRKIN
jgi:hypothetical protein